MAVLYDSSGGATTTSNVSSLNTAPTNTAGTYMLAWVAVDTLSANSFTMSYNGVSMSQVDSQSANSWTMVMFALANPATGSNTLQANWTGAGHAIIGMQTFTGVSSLGTVSKGTAASGNTSQSVTGTLGANDMLVGCFAYNSSPSNTSVSVGTQRFEDGDPAANFATNTGTGSISITWTRGVNATAAFMGVPLLAPTNSISSSPSSSPSTSISSSISSSPSTSISSSISSSPSSSPSPGYELYSRQQRATLPTDTTDLTTVYTTQDYLDVNASDDIRVAQVGSSGYVLHQFKDYIVGNLATFRWEGQTNYDPTLSPVVLQIFNTNTDTWETIDTDNSSAIDTDFILTANVPDLTDYKEVSGLVACRVYQSAD